MHHERYELADRPDLQKFFIVSEKIEEGGVTSKRGKALYVIGLLGMAAASTYNVSALHYDMGLVHKALSLGGIAVAGGVSLYGYYYWNQEQ